MTVGNSASYVSGMNINVRECKMLEYKVKLFATQAY